LPAIYNCEPHSIFCNKRDSKMAGAFFKLLSTLTLSGLLVACGGGGSTGPEAPSTASALAKYQSSNATCLPLTFDAKPDGGSRKLTAAISAPNSLGAASVELSMSYFSSNNCSGALDARITSPAATLVHKGTKTLSTGETVDKATLSYPGGSVTFTGTAKLVSHPNATGTFVSVTLVQANQTLMVAPAVDQTESYKILMLLKNGGLYYGSDRFDTDSDGFPNSVCFEGCLTSSASTPPWGSPTVPPILSATGAAK
jgi:hypothetical protein